MKHLFSLSLFIFLVSACADPSEPPAPEAPAAGEKDTPRALAARYLDALFGGNEEAVKDLWVTPDQLARFLDLGDETGFSVPKEKRAEYVAEAIKQQEDRMGRQLEKVRKGPPPGKVRPEIVEATAAGFNPTETVFRRIDLKLRDGDSGKITDGASTQEGLLIDGRWRFFEKP